MSFFCFSAIRNNKQLIYIQHFTIIIWKATCFSCKRQPSRGFTFQKYKKGNIYFWNVKSGGGLLQPKHVAFQSTIMKFLV